MSKYVIEYKGCPIGQLNTCIKTHVIRVAEADSEEQAQLKAYDKHEHIHHPIRVQLLPE
jgi:hypothetical protein